MAKESGGRSAPVAVRARKLREVAGFDTALAFSNHLGVTNSRWGNVENGAPLGIDLALILVRKTGVTLDWLYRGVPDGLTVDLARRLGALERSSITVPRVGS